MNLPEIDTTGLTAEQRLWAYRLLAHLALAGKRDDPRKRTDWIGFRPKKGRKRVDKQKRLW